MSDRSRLANQFNHDNCDLMALILLAECQYVSFVGRSIDRNSEQKIRNAQSLSDILRQISLPKTQSAPRKMNGTREIYMSSLE